RMLHDWDTFYSSPAIGSCCGLKSAFRGRYRDAPVHCHLLIAAIQADKFARTQLVDPGTVAGARIFQSAATRESSSRVSRSIRLLPFNVAADWKVRAPDKVCALGNFPVTIRTKPHLTICVGMVFSC